MDEKRVKDLFAMFTNLPDDQLVKWDYLCDNAISYLTVKLKENINTVSNMDRLCNAAAAVAYYNYILLNSSGGSAASAQEFKVGDISVKNSATSAEAILDAREMKETFLSEIADLLKDYATVFLAVAPEVKS